MASAVSLEHALPDVLPVFPEHALDATIAGLPAADLDLALRHKLVPLFCLCGTRYYGSAGPQARDEAAARGLRVVAAIDPIALRNAIFRFRSRKLLARAVSRLAITAPQHSALWRLTQPQLAMGLGLVLGLTLSGLLGGSSWPAFLLGTAASTFFLSLMALRILCLLSEPSAGEQRPRPLADAELPIYSVLVPLFRETEVLPQLLRALMAIRYPAGKLDIKLLLEERDHAMIEAVMRHALPSHFDIILVPEGAPQTKPRALTYALAFTRGSLITIYDCEDVPDPQQLRKAAALFAAHGTEVACIQAALSFYNSDENWLTRQFTAEYAALFGIILPGLAANGLPIPLGGTSNHFRMAALTGVGAWDPYNVTEDADLGCRLAQAGYRTLTLASTTLEEANTEIFNWMRQRRRWLKGFLHTWLVHMRNPIDLFHRLGWDGFWAFQTMTLGVFASSLLHPLLLAHALWFFASGRAVSNDEEFQVILAGLSAAILAAGYGTALVSAAIGLRRLGITGWWGTLATIPFYWMLSMPAAWMALWDFLLRPHHWHKTQHGLSRIFRPRQHKTLRPATRLSSP